MKSEKFWNKMAGTYDKRVLKTYKKTYDDTVGKSKKYLAPDYIVMDIACGSGITTVEIAKDVKEIYALDTSQKMIDIAREKIENYSVNNVRFSVTDIFDSRWKKDFYDVIMGFNILCYVKNTDSFLSRVHELLKPDGFFLSATDCSEEEESGNSFIQGLIRKFKRIPYKKDFSIGELESAVQKNKFHILESCNLHNEFLNIFIAAKK